MGLRSTTLFIALLSASCSPQGGPPFHKAIPPLTEVPGLGVSVLVPDEEGWAFFDPDGKGATIVKTGKSKMESYVISLDTYPLADSDSKSAALEIYKSIRERHVESTRFKALVIEDNAANAANGSPISFYYLLEDHGATQLPKGSAFMLLEVMGQLKVNPSRPDKLLNIAYSYRYALGNSDPRFKEKAKWVLDNVKFTEQPK